MDYCYNTKVSVIVPVYNSEKYLDQCIKSIINQTYKNIELLLIDDDSKDKSLLVCNKWANIDSRIIVIHKDNEGASFARKTGLKNSSGDYIMFVDSDDWISPDTIQMCINKLDDYNYDCILFSYFKEYSDKQIKHYIFNNSFSETNFNKCQKISNRVLGFDKTDVFLPENIDNLSPFWMKLYKREIALKGKFFSDKIIGTSEDTLFNLYALENCKSYCYINECLYHYRKTNINSLTTQYKKGLPEKWDILYDYILEFINTKINPDEYYDYFLNRVACASIGLMLNEINSSDSFLIKTRNIKDILNKPLYVKSYKNLIIKNCSLKWKVFFILCKYKFSTILALLLYLINYLRAKI